MLRNNEAYAILTSVTNYKFIYINNYIIYRVYIIAMKNNYVFTNNMRQSSAIV